MFKRKSEPPAAKPKAAKGIFSTDLMVPRAGDLYDSARARTFQREITKKNVGALKGTAMDADQLQLAKAQFQDFAQNVPEAIYGWYGGQGFIGYQTCAMIFQNWLVDKACTMTAKDAVRNFFELSVPEDEKVDEKDLSALRQLDVAYKLKANMVEFIRFGRCFGIRHALFLVDGIDYELPFNPDGVKKGSYHGISQIDPYWISPELDISAASNPTDPAFYEPTWWRVNGQRIHKSHFVIVKGSEVPDILKPTYFYGGVSVPQKIYERVYAFERTANEAPMLAMTKRTTAIHTDLAQAEANSPAFFERINLWAYLRDNYGIKVLGEEEQIEQFDTSLTDLDAVIMTQAQIVAAEANVPATKLLGTTPKGFNSTGEYEESSYHEELESIQEHELTDMANRHHDLCIRSDIGKKFPVEISWRSLDVPTAAERADINLKKAQTGTQLIQSGAIDGVDEHNRLVHDPDSGYTSLTEVGDISELEPPPGDDEEKKSDNADE
jgi:hypothetical protein